jgi:CRP-like cAMP-binding protein
MPPHEARGQPHVIPVLSLRTQGSENGGMRSASAAKIGRRGPPPPRTWDEYRTAVDAAAARSVLARIPAAAMRQLVDRGTRLDTKARTIFYREGDPPMVVLVVHGSVRVYVTAEDGREFTLFWAHPGDWLGHLLVTGGPIDVNAQAVSDTTLHVIPAELLKSLAHSDIAVARELLQAASFRVAELVGTLRMFAFMDLRQRVSHRLVELAFRQPAGSALVAEVSQQDLADLVGSPRTSVARIIAALRTEGIARTVPRGIEVVRPEQLVPNLATVPLAS